MMIIENLQMVFIFHPCMMLSSFTSSMSCLSLMKPRGVAGGGWPATMRGGGRVHRSLRMQKGQAGKRRKISAGKPRKELQAELRSTSLEPLLISISRSDEKKKGKEKIRSVFAPSLLSSSYINLAFDLWPLFPL